MHRATASQHLRQLRASYPFLRKVWERDQKLIEAFGGYRIQDEVVINAPGWASEFLHTTKSADCPLQANIDFEWLLFAYRR